MPLLIRYKVMQPITTQEALDRVERGVQPEGVWVSDFVSMPVVLILEISCNIAEELRLPL